MKWTFEWHGQLYCVNPIYMLCQKCTIVFISCSAFPSGNVFLAISCQNTLLISDLSQDFLNCQNLLMPNFLQYSSTSQDTAYWKCHIYENNIKHLPSNLLAVRYICQYHQNATNSTCFQCGFHEFLYGTKQLALLLRFQINSKAWFDTGQLACIWWVVMFRHSGLWNSKNIQQPLQSCCWPEIKWIERQRILVQLYSIWIILWDVRYHQSKCFTSFDRVINIINVMNITVK